MDVTYNNGTIRLAARLMLPPSTQASPAVVIIQGSGPSDRSNTWSQDIAEELLHQGVVVLLTDKRGAGASTGDWRTSTFSDLAGDALAGVEFLRTCSEVDAANIGVVGLSQGGQVAPLAAASSEQIAFVIAVSSKAVSFAEGSFGEMRNTARQAGLSESDVQVVLRINLAAGRFLLTGAWEPYFQARAHALQTGARAIIEGFPSSQGDPIWHFLRSAITWDPLPYWLQVHQPVLIVYGEDDEEDNTPVRESVRRLEHTFGVVQKTDHQIVVVPGVGHGIRDPQSRRLAPRFVEALGSWLGEHVKR
jgi:uncharacterized protein